MSDFSDKPRPPAGEGRAGSAPQSGYPPPEDMQALVQRLEHEIAERRRAEDALRESEELHRKAFELSNDGIVITQDGRYVFINQVFLRTIGRPMEELLGNTLGAFVHPDDRERLADYTRRRRAGEPAPANYELRIIKPDGTLVHVDVNVIEVVFKGARAFLAYLRDITERKRAEEQLRQSEEKYRQLVQHAPAGIYQIDFRSRRFVAVNDVMCRYTGYTRDEFLTLDPVRLLTTESAELFLKRVADILAGIPVTPSVELKIRGKNAREFWILIQVNYTYDEDGPLIATVIAHDTTERKRMEEERDRLQMQLLQAQKMESVGRLAGGVAHDFNNILAAIMGYSEMALLQTEPGTRLHHNLLEILKAAKRSADLTGQLLAFARRQVTSPKVLNLNDTVSGMLKMLQRLIGENIDLAWIPGHSLWNVRIDASQVDQMLANLLVNARDAISGQGRVTIETCNVEVDEGFMVHHGEFPPGDYVLLSVSDTGCGMDRETLDHVFEPFFTTKEVGKGTGLGLATVFGIARQNEGFVNAYSEPGRGTTFRIYLPRFAAEPPSEDQLKDDRKPRRGEETILLAEDDEAVLALTRSLLEALGYRVVTARTPDLAIQVVAEQQETIHMLLTDVVMPGMNGKDLAERLVSLRPGLKCLFMSGYPADVIAHHGILEEGVQFVQKPFSIQSLAEAVRRVLDQE